MSKWVYGLIIGLLVLVSGWLYVSQDQGEEIQVKAVNKPGKVVNQEISKTIIIYVTGDVAHPDVYEVPEQSRLYEVIEVSGGFNPTASKESLNLARYVFDGEKIYVPSQEEMDDTSRLAKAKDNKVSINLATEEELLTLTGIGVAKAQAIIDYRTINGPFQRIEDIMKVTGIKDAMFNKIKDDIVI